MASASKVLVVVIDWTQIGLLAADDVVADADFARLVPLDRGANRPSSVVLEFCEI